MANLKEIRSRINSVSSTMKITSAMKMVSAAKLKKAQDQMTNIRPYSVGLSKMIQNLLPNIDLSEVKLTSSAANAKNKTLILAITSNRGLCGAFNANIFKKAKECSDDCEVFCIGKKGAEIFKRNKYNVIKEEFDLLDNIKESSSTTLSKEIINNFEKGEWSKVIVIYNKFKNAGTQIIESKQVLPIVLNNKDQIKSTSTSDYIFEPDTTTIINHLMPKEVKTNIFEAILNSIASEHGARMTAMHKATDNANELKEDLTLTYNRQRQAAITNEILEIVAGAEALKGS
ncbi:ATP synthase F1 subunit gamma [Flavobacteriales bacterium]|nr:ATP synthase F1 subunit gamma [Flavobacteriales bacterium]